MNSILNIKNYFIYLFFVLGTYSCFGQVSDSLEVKKSQKKLGFGTWTYLQPIVFGDGFLGQGNEGIGGGNLGFNVFIFKDFFASANLGSNYFRVIDKSVTGNYNKSRAFHAYLSLGYQFLKTAKFRSGVSASITGTSNFKSKGRSSNGTDWLQRDSGRIRAYEIHFDYMVDSDFSIYASYIYRHDKMSIRTAPEIQSVFDNATFHNIGFGLKLYF